MYTSNRGSKRHRQLGFSYVELLWVIAIMAVVLVAGYMFYQVFRGERFTLEAGGATANQSILDPRNNAWNGVEDAQYRTVDVAKIGFPKGVRLVTKIEDGEFPGLPQMKALGPEDKIEFEAQTARTKDKKWGALIIQDVRTGTKMAFIIPYLNSPPLRYVKRSGDKSFQPMIHSIF